MAEPTKPTILIVDDEPEILHSLRGLLRLEFTVHTASSGAEALDILEREPIEVILSDQRMPEMTGVELFEQARSERPRAIRVMFTGYTDINALIAAINDGEIFRYLTKPWDPDHLVAVMREAAQEYRRQAEQKQVFIDLQDFQMKCLSLVEGLQDQTLGTLNETGEESVAEITQLGYPLLERFDRTTGLMTEEGGSG